MPTPSPLDLERMQALKVLREMLYLSSSKSPEGAALSVAVSTLAILLQDAGFTDA